MNTCEATRHRRPKKNDEIRFNRIEQNRMDRWEKMEERKRVKEREIAGSGIKYCYCYYMYMVTIHADNSICR